MIAEWQDRVYKERDELVVKITKLAEFMDTKDFAELNSHAQYLLTEQFKHMSAYLAVLKLRIANFQTGDPK